MKNRKAKFMSVLLSLSMLANAPVYAEDFSDFSDDTVALDETESQTFNSPNSDLSDNDEDFFFSQEDSFSDLENESAENGNSFVSDVTGEEADSEGEISEDQTTEPPILLYDAAYSGHDVVEAAIEADPDLKPNCNIYTGNNLEKQDYFVWSSPVSSYLTSSPDGGLMKIQEGAVDGTLVIEYYDTSYNYQRTVTLKLSLPIFGAFYETADNYYILSGQENPDNDTSQEVYRLTKYTKGWQAAGSCGLSNVNTKTPFRAGSARMVQNGNYMFIRTCHEMQNGHQANITFSVDTSNMTLVDEFHSVWNTDTGYVSHSLNQFIQVDNGTLLGTDHGEGYPTAFVLLKYNTDISDGHFIDGLYNTCTALNFMKLTNNANIHYNYTGASIGAFEYSDSSYLIAGTKDTDDASTRNVFITCMDKSSGETFTHFYSNYAGTDEYARTPHLVKTGSNRFVLLWSSNGYVYYTAVDGTGQQIGTTHKMAGNLSDCVPFITGGKLIWYTWKNQFITFYEINLDDLSDNHAVRIEDGHRYDYADKAENNLLTGTCRICGYQKPFAVPTSVDVRKKDASSQYFRTMEETYQMDLGGTADLKWYSGFSSSASDYDQISNWKVTSSDENILAVEQTSNTTATITAKKAGIVTLTVQEVTNPSVTFTSTISINMITEDTASWYFTAGVFFYDGTEHKASVFVRVNGKQLTEGTDYELLYDGDLINAGTVAMTIHGIGDYAGSIETTYKIQTLNLSSARFSIGPAYYNQGAEVTPEITGTYEGRPLVKDVDYTVEYHNNTSVGSSAWVGIQGIGNYTGYITKGFSISGCPIDDFTVTLSQDELPYNGTYQLPDVTVQKGDLVLTKNTDFYVSSTSIRELGTGTITVYGRGNYSGTVTKEFQVVPADINDTTIKLYQDPLTYDGTAKEVRAVRIVQGTRSLSEGSDFTVSYSNNVNAGTASVIIQGIGNYTGTYTEDFTIAPADITAFSASLSETSFEYDGSEKQPEVTVSGNGKSLVNGTDFTVSYENNIDAGTASVIIRGTSNYTGVITVNFTIAEKSPGKDDSDSGNTGKDDSGKGDSGKDDSGKDDSGKDDSGKDDSGKDDSGKDDSGKDDSDKGDSGKDDSGKDDSGKDDSGKDDSGKDDSSKDDSGKDDSGKDDSGKDDSGKDDSGKDDSGKDDSSKDDSGKDDSSKDDSSKNDSSENGSNSNSGNSDSNNNNNSSDDSSAEITPIPTKINVTSQTLTQSKKKTNLTAGIVTDGKITMKSSNSKIVKISGTQVIPVAPGKATVTITVAKGQKYTAATKKITVTVIPVGTSIRSLKSKSKKTATVTWKTVKSISGYQINYSQKSNMKKAKTITVKSSAKTVTLKKLASKKKYYVRIRTYKVVKGKKYYSNWSTLKSVKVK